MRRLPRLLDAGESGSESEPVFADAADLGGSLLEGARFAFGKDSEDSEPPVTTGNMAIQQLLSAA